MDREQLISTLKSVIISKKGGVHISEINKEYKALMGQNIPLESVTGCDDLQKFLCSVPGVSVKLGIITATSVNTAHIEKMISKQKTKVDKRVRVKRLDGARKYSTQRCTNQTVKNTVPSAIQLKQSLQAPNGRGRGVSSYSSRNISNQRQESGHQRNYVPPQTNRNFSSHYGNSNFTNNRFMGQNPQEIFYNNGRQRTADFKEGPLLNHINGWKVIGDDLMLSVLNPSWPYQYDPLCCSGLTIQKATTEIYRNGCPSKVIIVLGSVDVLIGNSEEQLLMDMCDLLIAIHTCCSEVVVCTLPALGISPNWDRVKKLMALNCWVMQSGIKFTDLNASFCNRDWTIDYTCYESQPLYVRGSSEAHLLWSKRGCDIVLNNLSRWQIQYYNSNWINHHSNSFSSW